MRTVPFHHTLLTYTVLTAFVLVALFHIVPTIAAAQANPTINYQGKLTDATGQAVPNGTYNMRFYLYNATGGATTTAIWTETLTGTNQVTVTNGLFSVMLGSTTPLTSLNFNQTLYLGVEIGGTGAPAWDGEMSPRKILGTVPAAFEARRLSGIASSSFLRSDEADTLAATTANTLLTIQQNGTGDILNLYDGSTEVFTVTDGGLVGIGTATTSRLLNLGSATNAGVRITDTTNNVQTEMRSEDFQGFIGTFSNHDLRFVTNNTSRGVITNAGNWGIGTTTTTARLTVDGDLRLTGALRDATNDAGTTGQVLLSTGTSTSWVSTSTLGFGTSNVALLNDLTNVNATNVLGSLLYYNGTTWDDLATSSLNIALVNTTGTLPVNRGGTGATTDVEARANLGLELGTDVQAFDTELAALAGLTSAADTLPYFTGAGTAGVTTLTAFGRSLIDDADATAARATLSLGSLATLSAVGSTEITDNTITVDDINNSATIGANPALAANEVFFGTTGLIFEGSTANTAELLLTAANPGSDVTVTIPATTGTLITTGDTGTVSNTMLANAAVSFGGVSLALGGTDATPAFNLTDATALPISTGVAGLGTGVAAALGINVGSAGALVTNGGALGTPSSGTLTNATGLPIVGGTTGTLSVARGGTGATTASAARTNLGATTVGSNVFTLTNPSAISFLRVNADNTVSALNASDFRTAIGAGVGGGSVSSVALSAPTGFTVSGSPVTTTGTLALSYAAGYEGLLTASSTAYNTFYTTPSSRITAGIGLVWSGNTLNTTGILEDLVTLGAPTTDGDIIVATGAGTFAYENGATARASLGLTIGTNVQAQDAELQAIAGLTSAADTLPYFTGSGTAGVTTLSSFARTLLDDADNTAARSTLGLGTLATLSTVGAATITDNEVSFGEINYGNTLAGNPALLVDECYFTTTTTGGGFICEGSTADTNEQLYLFPDVNGADTTQTIALTDSAMTGTFDGNNFAGGAIGTGDLLYGSGAGTIAELGIGTTGRVLQVVGGVPAWVATSSLGITGVSTFLGLTDTPSDFSINGAIPYESSDALAFSSNFTYNGTNLTVAGGVLGSYFGSTAADIADAGAIRLGNAELIAWESSPAGTDVSLSVNASEQLVFTGGGAFIPAVNDGASLGVSGTAFADLFLASGGVVNFDAGDLTLTDTGTNILTLAGGNFAVGANFINNDGGSEGLSFGTLGETTVTTGATTNNAFTLAASSLTTGSAARIYSNSANTSARSILDIVNDNAAASGAVALRIQQDSTADIVNIFDGATEVFTILDGGNVGIGTTTPGTKLDVWGSLRVGTSSTPLLLADTASNLLGINTDSPIGRLSVSTQNSSQTWQEIGTELNISAGDNTIITTLSPNRVAFIDRVNDDLRVYEFDGTTWSQVGTELNISGANNPALTPLSPNRVAFIDQDNDDLRVYEFNGSIWSQVGTELNISGVGSPALTTLSPNRVAFIDSTNDDLRVYEFNGSIWSQVGSELNIPGTAAASLSRISPSRIAFVDNGNNDLRVYEFNGSTWSQVGNDLNIGGMTFGPSIDTLSPNRVAYIDGSNDDLRVYEFNGSTWSQVGTELNISAVGVVSISTLSPNRVAFIDGVNQDLRVYQFSEPAVWVGDDEDFPFFTISDAGFTQIEGLKVSSGLTVSAAATGTFATNGITSPALTVNGTSIFGDDMLGRGRLLLGTSTAATSTAARFSLQRLSFNGAGVVGLDQYLQTTNATLNAVQFGNRFFLDAANTATTTTVGSIYRVRDNTTYGNTVRGLEVQADRGSNTQGENTALSGFARTFGVRGTTRGDAGGSFEPAGGFFETQGTTQGNAIRGFSQTITTSALLSLYQASSTFTGTGLEMNFGNTTGDFASTSSRFIDLQNAGTSVFSVTAFGTTTIGDGITQAGLQIPNGGICVDDDGACTASTSGRITAREFQGGNSDLAEIYFSRQALAWGEIVSLEEGLSVTRATTETKRTVLGVVSTAPGLVMGADDTSLNADETAYPIALAGRVPIKLSNENGPIKAGDELTLSSLPGVAMKATSSGVVIGIALEDFDETRAYSDTYINQYADNIMVPEYVPVTSPRDPRIQDGCYMGGGGEVGIASCVPLVATTSDAQVHESETLAAAEARDRELRRLARQSSAHVTLTADQVVQVGQIVMFVDRGYRYLGETEQSMLAGLMMSAEEARILTFETDTIWSRLVRLASGFVDGVLSLTGIKADRVETGTLCVDDVCLTADDLRALLERSNSDEQVIEVMMSSSSQPTSPTRETEVPVTPSVDGVAPVDAASGSVMDALATTSITYDEGASTTITGSGTTTSSTPPVDNASSTDAVFTAESAVTGTTPSASSTDSSSVVDSTQQVMSTNDEDDESAVEPVIPPVTTDESQAPMSAEVMNESAI